LLNRDFIFKWISAMTGGDYEQGQKYLRPTTETYCCLGVACDLYDPNGWVAAEEGEIEWGYAVDVETEEEERSDTGLPRKVLDHIGLTKEQESMLMELNDEGASFVAIANMLRYFLKTEKT
jgi:hypothetical protein